MKVAFIVVIPTKTTPQRFKDNMSNIDPMSGNPIQAVETARPAPAPRVNFDYSQHLQMNSSNEAKWDSALSEYDELAFAASKTKFATGDSQKDIQNYLAMRKIGELMSGLLSND